MSVGLFWIFFGGGVEGEGKLCVKYLSQSILSELLLYLVELMILLSLANESLWFDL